MIHIPAVEMAIDAGREAASCANSMRLPLRQMVWRGSAGEMAGVGSGSSMDFQDHRAYLPGDDPRHINWSAYSRTGNYTLKVYREEVSPTVEILMDVSNSMFLDAQKAHLSCALLAFCNQSALKDGASTSIQLVGATDHHFISGEEVHTGNWVTRLSEQAENRKLQQTSPSFEQIPLRSGSLRILISDLLFTTPPAPIMRALLRNRGSAIILTPYSPNESNPEWNGVCEFRDVESGHMESRDADKALIKRYMSAYGIHFRTWKEEALRHQVPLARVEAGRTLHDALSHEALVTRTLEPHH